MSWPPELAERFADWVATARSNGEPEPTAMTLATTDATGRPSARVVLIKSIDSSGIIFFTNAQSRKGRELAANPWAAMVWLSKSIGAGVQVRAEGPVLPIAAAASDEYFASRPRDSQLGAWASAQSRPIPENDSLHNRLSAVALRFADGPVPRPPYWGGFCLSPERIEFWTGRAHRLHDRELYERLEGHWRSSRLFP